MLALRWVQTREDLLRDAGERLPSALRYAVPLVAFAIVSPIHELSLWALAFAIVFGGWAAYRAIEPVFRSAKDPVPVELLLAEKSITLTRVVTFDMQHTETRVQFTKHGARLEVGGRFLTSTLRSDDGVVVEGHVPTNTLFIPKRVFTESPELEVALRRDFKPAIVVVPWRDILIFWAQAAGLIAIFLAAWKFFSPE